MPARRVTAITGTPGVGKSSLVSRLRRLGVEAHGISEYLGASRVVQGRDRKRGADIVDTKALDRTLLSVVASSPGPWAFEGHFAHDLEVATHALVLRLSPRVLARRLRARGWSQAKVRENVEAEAIDLILQEAVKRHGPRRTFELDCTGLRRHEVASIVAAACLGDAKTLKNLKIGTVNWSAEILQWF
jgi:adenylate kinase